MQARFARRRHLIRGGMLAALAAAAILAAGGCGSGQQTAGQGAGPVQGGTYRYPVQSRIAGLTPLDATDLDDLQISHQIFEGLVRYETRSDGTMETVPCLAESWTVNRDATVFRFKLRRRAKFQPPVSRAVTARDVVRSWELATDPAHPAAHADVLAPIEGLDDSGLQVDRRDGLVGVKAIGKWVLRVQLRYPCADFPERLGDPAAAVMPVSYIDIVGRHEFERRPVGTGPFLVERWSSTSVRLIRNPDYWDTSRAPYLQRVNIHVVPNAARQWRQFRAGRIDISEVPASRERAISVSRRVSAGEWSIEQFPTMAVAFVGVDMSDATLGAAAKNGLSLRSALAYAADRTGVCEVAEGGAPAPVTVLLPPALSGSDADDGPLAYDPDAAKKAMIRAGAARLRSRFWVTPDAASQAVGEVLAAGWLTAGIHARVVPSQGAEAPGPDARIAGAPGQQTFLGCWTADYPGADAYLVPLFSTGAATGASALSPMASTDPVLGSLIAQAMKTVDDQARAALWNKAEQRILASGACIPLFNVRLVRVVRSSVHGQQLDALGFMDMSRVWVEP